MITHNLIQGTPAWHTYRSEHFNASDAPAMLGCSTYKTRSQLLHELATGQVPEVDPATQRRFDAGHAAEAAARPIAEREIGEDLFPIVGSEGRLSASFDGLNMAGTVVWEHKLMNVDLADSLSRGIIPEQYHPQLEQQLMVSGAEKALFMATSQDRTAMECVWYTSRPELRNAILQGWTQFAIDLAAYVPPEVIVPAVAAPQIGLPAVSIAVSGQIALVDNLDKFGVALTAYIAKLNREPETDQDFANLEDAVKRLKAAEEQLDAAEASALGQTDSIDTMRRTVALHRETAKTTRILIDKLVKAEKENRRNKIISDAAAGLQTHVAALNTRLGKPYMPAISGDFQGVVKGLKSLDSMKDKVAGELARCKIEANATADRIQANLTTLRELASGHAFLFADAAQLVGKANDDLTALVKSRIADHQAAEAAKEEAQRARIRAEEQEKAEREARAKLAAEQEAIAKAERERIAAEAAKVERIVTAPGIAPVTPPGPAAAAITHAQVVQMMPASVRQAMAPAAAVTPPTLSPPTLRLGQINDRLAPIQITAEGLRALGFAPAATDRASKLYHEESFQGICTALLAHISEVQDQYDAVAA
jgi:putative phage-type endonuclease